MRVTEDYFAGHQANLLKPPLSDGAAGAARTPADTIPGDTSTTETIALGVAEEGYIGPDQADADWFAVTLTAGTTYEFSLSGSGGTALYDPWVFLYDDDGNYVADNDDAAGLDSLLVFTIQTTGTYYVSAQAYQYDSFVNTGQYTLTVDIGTPEPGPDPLDSIDWGTQVTPTSGVITYYFAKNGETFDGETSLGWSAAEKAAVAKSLDQFENIVDVTFVEAANAASADFTLVIDDDPAGPLGYFNPPGEVNEGVGWFNRDGTGWDTTGLAQGGYGFITLIHEFGHGMGLAHPHDGGGTSVIMEGVTAPFGSYGLFDLNQGIYTTMSYNDGWQTAPHGLSPSNDYGYQGTMMALDIAVLQEKYGANLAYRSGADTYTLPVANAAGTFYACIWDAGGTDTIRHIGTAAATIDLRAATLEYEAGGGGFVSYVEGIHGGFTIADGVVIENAKGGSGNDWIVGNQAANSLDGGAGDDSMAGGAGDDLYFVDSAADVVTETAGNGTADRVAARASYALAAGVSIELLTTTASGGTTAIDLTGNALKQTITGNAGTNTLKDGGGAADILQGLGGNDTYLVYAAGTTVADGSGQGTDRVAAGVDFVLGAGVHVEVLTTTSSGGTAAIDLTGNALKQEITGNAGGNILHDGGQGAADILRGLGGNDTYRVYNAGDVIVETAAQGTADRVMAAVDYKLASGVHVEIMTTNGGAGTAAIDLTGNEFAQTITGNAGDNRLEGKGGADTLRGLGGKDTFVFATKLGGGNVDTIIDFNVADDRFLLSDAIFTALAPGTLSVAAFRANTTGLAGDGSDRIIYETDTGELYYDADGTGATAGIHFATIAAGLAPTNLDFSIA